MQFGFLARHSINHALISMTESIKECLDSRRFGCGIFLDLQKASDTVNVSSIYPWKMLLADSGGGHLARS